MWNEIRDLATHVIVRMQPLRVNAVTVLGDRVKVTMSFESVGARCPSCHKVSRRVHSRYTRRPTDMVWGGLTTQLELHIRRFHCDTPDCAQQIYAEQLPQYLRRYGRRTESLEDQLQLLAWVAGGEAGTDVAERFHIPISADTLLRITRRRGGSADIKTPRVLGVDDWAFRKGRRYGTILCDLERACVVDLLPDREAKTLADWLIAHPGVEIISRDRGGAYAEGARQGAPNAIQVADRFHLLMNLKDAVKRVAEQHHAVIRKCAVEAPAVAAPKPTTNIAVPETTPPVQKAVRQSDIEKQARDERYRARYDAVTKLHVEGVTLREISQRLGLARNTITKLLAAPEYPGVPSRGQSQPQVAAPFHDYLVERWNAGIHNIRQLQREICEQGYTGTYSALWNYLQPWQRTRPAKRASKHPDAAPTPRQAAWALITHPDKRTELQKQQVALWSDACPELSKTHDLAQAFGTLVRSRQADQLDNWLNAARDSGIAIWTRFAASLKSDYDAVSNALKLPWSNGPVEGNIQRLKLVKRQAYGRANLDLLKARVMQPA
jgi:transposase